MDFSTFVEGIAEITKIGFSNMHDVGDPQQMELTMPYKNFQQLQTFVLDLIQQAAENLNTTVDLLSNCEDGENEAKRILSRTKDHLYTVKRLRQLSDFLAEKEREYLHNRLALTKQLGQER